MSRRSPWRSPPRRGIAGAPTSSSVPQGPDEERRLERLRADFVANASHELRTPLASVVGFIETIQGPARNDVQARERFLDIMLAQARRMSRLIDDLLSLSRVELNEHVRPAGVVDLVPLLAHVRDTLGPMHGGRDVEVEIRSSVPALTVNGDQDELIGCSKTSCRTPSSTAPRAGRSRFSSTGKRGTAAATRPRSRFAITVRESPPNTCRGSPSGSTGSMWHRAARRAGPASGLPSSSISSTGIAAGFDREPARRGRELHRSHRACRARGGERSSGRRSRGLTPPTDRVGRRGLGSCVVATATRV